MPGLSRALEPAQGFKVAFGRLLLLPVTKKGFFFGPKLKDRITPHVNFFQQAAKERKGKDSMGKAGKRKEMVKDWCGASCVWKIKYE